MQNTLVSIKKKSGKRGGRGKEKYMSSYVKIKGEGKANALREDGGHVCTHKYKYLGRKKRGKK
jgi:hypothetical protein